MLEQNNILLGHGSGGKLSNELIKEIFVKHFNNSILNQQGDSALLNIPGHLIAFTTDSFVVDPIFFKGGDIGKLAVAGTVNDLAVTGAKPLFLSVGFIIEEGFSLSDLERIAKSMAKEAKKANVKIVTGDTKVVDKGKGDGVFINTSGIGSINESINIQPDQIQPGDRIIVNGDLGRHGMAIMAHREGLAFESEIESDVAPLSGLVQQLIRENIEIHCLRDLTRGGLSSALNEVAASSQKTMEIDDTQIPVREDVAGACEILGLDPLYVACEGRFVAWVSAKDTDRALKIMQSHPDGEGSRAIGSVIENGSILVVLKNSIGVERILDLLSGEQLPRIC